MELLRCQVIIHFPRIYPKFPLEKAFPHAILALHLPMAATTEIERRIVASAVDVVVNVTFDG